MNLTELKAQAEPRERAFYWHWQNLNDRKDGTHGSGLRHGRCWWHFRSSNKWPGPDIRLEWLLTSSSFGLGAEINEEDVTFQFAIPPIALYLSFSTNFSLIRRFAKQIPLQYYPETLVIDEREASLKIHSGTAWLKFGASQSGWRADSHRGDPWYKRGLNFSINPFEWTFQRHEVRRTDGSWGPAEGYWNHGKDQPVTYSGTDGREVFTAPYFYILKDGDIQYRTATFCVDRREWRPRCLQWTKMFAKVRTCIDVWFDDEVGERSGSWKGGTIGCGWELRPDETPLEALHRMERTRKF